MDLDHAACYRAIRTRDARFDGRLFVGVRTTGIYCRPICPARTPRRENVMFFRSAAAAQEAGFRPCLRCRPETAPELAAWRGTSNTVTRALSLIEGGAMDEADVDALAARLGIGSRQLRRLFHRHLGASPVAVAQTRRVLFAKQLIQDTHLPMTDVALASGFGSVRRFNEMFRELFGSAPTAVRRGGPAVSRTEGVVTLRLAYRPPYDWAAMLAFLRVRAIPGIESVSESAYARTIDVGGHHGIVVVEPETDRAALRVTVQSRSLPSLPAVLARLRRVFDLAADPSSIASHLAEDPLLAPLVAERPGLRVPGAWDPFELAVRAVLGQQITVAAARGLAARLVVSDGEPLTIAPFRPDLACSLTHVFPGPERVARARLASLGMPRSRAAAVSSLAAAFVADPHLFDVRRSLDEAIARLRALPGIGEWTAQYIAMRELREPDAFPHGDAGLLRAVERLTGTLPTSRELHMQAERWRPWRAYAAQHLWAGLASAASSPSASSPSASAGRRRSGRAA